MSFLTRPSNVRVCQFRHFPTWGISTAWAYELSMEKREVSEPRAVSELRATNEVQASSSEL